MGLKHLVLLAVLGVWPHATAWAEYGDPGVVEIGGSFSFAHQSLTIEDDDLNTTQVEFLPFVGVFAGKGLQLGGSLDVRFQDREDVSVSLIGFLAHIAYLTPGGNVHVGPTFFLGYQREDDNLDTLGSLTISGPVVGGGLKLNAPLGDSGLFTFGMIFRYHSFDLEAESEAFGSESSSGNQLIIGPNAGFSVYF